MLWECSEVTQVILDDNDELEVKFYGLNWGDGRTRGMAKMTTEPESAAVQGL